MIRPPSLLQAVMGAIVEISGVDFAYGQQLVLKHVDLAIERGSILGLVGPNGGGKTTLIRLLLGLLEPTRGQIRVDQLPPWRAIARGDVIGYLPQNPQLATNFPISARQLVRLGLAGKTGLLRRYASGDLEFVERLLGYTGAAAYAQVPIGELSGGQLQRVLIARALVARPRLLLLDEPTTGIDQLGQRQFAQFLRDLKEEFDLTVVFVSHDLRAVWAVCDRIACLNLTLHYHDVPQRLPAELAWRMFACDLAAMGLAVAHEHGREGEGP